ncbi:hypothetical protein ACEXAJ_09980 [Fusobacterium necrophorum subsp. funduliforme]
MNLKVKNEMTSLELVEQINFFRKKEGKKTKLEHFNLLNVIRDEFEEEINALKIQAVEYRDKKGEKRPMFILTLSQAKQVLVRESKYVRRAIIQYIEKLEQALKKPRQEQTKLDFQNQTPIRTTWKGEPVMEVVQLSKMTGITNGNIHWRVYGKKVTLRYKELQEYKQENRKVNHKGYSAISILSKETVIAICKKYGIYEKYKDFINNYFRVDNRLEDKTPKVPVIRANFDKVDSKEEIDVRKAEVVVKTLPYIGDAQLRDYIAEHLSRELLGKKFFRAFDCTMKCLALREDLNRKGLKHKREVEERMKNSESYLSLPQAGKDIIDSIFE